MLRYWLQTLFILTNLFKYKAFTHERQNKLENKEMETIILTLFEVDLIDFSFVQETTVECGCSAGFVHKVF